MHPMWGAPRQLRKRVCGLVKTLMLVPKHPDDSGSSSRTPNSQLSTPQLGCTSPFIVPSLYCMSNPHNIISWCHDCLLHHFGGKTTAHAQRNCHGLSAHLPASMPNNHLLQKFGISSSLFQTRFRACDTLPQVFQCALILWTTLLTKILT